jgi:hypothetical protein
MMIRKKIIFFALLVALLVFFSSCDRRGSLNPNSEPIIYITSYGGVDSLSAIGDSIIFQQTIYWEAYDSDGWVETFAYRILDEDGTAISTPGKEFIVGDENGNGITDDNEGWVLHYEAGADESIPLDHPDAKTTVWTTDVYVEINFPAHGEQLFHPNGDPVIDPETGNFIYSPVTSIFEIKCIDDRGDESEIFRRYFKSTSKTPSILAVESTQGPIDRKQIGTGVILKFRISDKDPLIGDAPNYFLFKLERKDTAGNVIPESEGGYPVGPVEGGFFSTQFQKDVTEFLLIPEAAAEVGAPGPFIKVNELADDGTTYLDSTFLTVIAYDLAGIPSQPKTISFAVKEGFYPGSIIYNGFTPNSNGLPNYTYNDIFAIGTHHFSTKKADFLSSVDVPEEVSSDGYRYGLPFWIDRDSTFTAINSPNLKIYMHWGFQGEYGEIGQSSTTVTNSPYNQRVGLVLDENTQAIYFSELKFFDLQLDGEPYHYPPLAGQVLTYYDELGGWTRIPVGSDIDQRTILFGLDSGEHIFRVRAVDLSNIGDPTPAEMRFVLVDPVPKAAKNGILIIDDDANHPVFAPDIIMDQFYNDALSDYSGVIDHYDLWQTSLNPQEVSNYNSLLHFNTDVICPVDLQNYKLVIYHSDQAGGGSKFHRNNNSFNLFFKSGGNLLVSLGDNANNAYAGCNNNNYRLLADNFGIPIRRLTTDPEMVVKISQSNLTNPYLIGANPASTVNVPLNLELDPEKVWNTLLNTAQGLGPASYFGESLFEPSPENPQQILPERLYTYVCKDTTAATMPPTAEQYEFYNGKTIALKYTNANSTNYMFGFALPYMQLEDVKAMFNQILADLGMM